MNKNEKHYPLDVAMPQHCAYAVRDLPQATVEQRERALNATHWNEFAFPSGMLTVDMLSDSGTTAMTNQQLATLFLGDEAYGRNTGYYVLLDTFRDIFERGGEKNWKKILDLVRTDCRDIEKMMDEVYLCEYEGGLFNGGAAQMERPNSFIIQQGRAAESVLMEIVKKIRSVYPDCAITLSIGEKTKESYRLYKEAGADRYLLRHETANEDHYRHLHPEQMSLANRKQCLRNLKELGYQTGAGFMVGAPGQTLECLAEDLIFLKELKPEMVGIGPFIPHHDTKFADEPAGSVELTLFLLSVLRIILPKCLLPATTALGTADPKGREKGLLAGANVVMPNLSPVKDRKKYELYDNKICTGDEAAECRVCLKNRVKSVGFELVEDRGDVAL
mgnify:CR=1 FL=1